MAKIDIVCPHCAPRYTAHEAVTGKCLRTFKGHMLGVHSVSFSRDGRFALSGSYDKTLRLWAIPTGQSLRTFEGHTDAVMSVTFSPDGRFILSGSADNTIKLWEIEWEDEAKKDPWHRSLQGLIVNIFTGKWKKVMGRGVVNCATGTHS